MFEISILEIKLKTTDLFHQEIFCSHISLALRWIGECPLVMVSNFQLFGSAKFSRNSLESQLKIDDLVTILKTEHVDTPRPNKFEKHVKNYSKTNNNAMILKLKNFTAV